MNGALESEAVKRALIDAIDSELVDEVWLRLLASEETQRLVERIAEAPEIRAAISAQSVGFIEDIGHTIGDATRSIDDALERIVRRIFFRRRSGPSRPSGPAPSPGRWRFGLDGADRQPRLLRRWPRSRRWSSPPSPARKRRLRASRWCSATAAWLALGGLYLVGFWSLAGQTLGMRFLGIRLAVGARAAAAPRRSGG